MLAYDKNVYIELPRDDTLPSPTNKPLEAPAFEVSEGVTTPQAEPQKKPKAPAGLVAKILEDNADEARLSVKVAPSSASSDRVRSDTSAHD